MYFNFSWNIIIILWYSSLWSHTLNQNLIFVENYYPKHIMQKKTFFFDFLRLKFFKVKMYLQVELQNIFKKFLNYTILNLP